MRRCITMFTGALLVVAGTLSVAFAAAVRNGDTDTRWAQPGRVVLKLVDHPGALPSAQKTGASKVDQILARHDVELIRPVAPAPAVTAKAGTTDLSRVFIAHYRDGADPYRVAAELSALPSIEYAEPVYFYKLNVVPNDDDWPSQTLYLGSRMQFPAAWDNVKGEDGDVVVAIIDGGTWWMHVDIEPNLWNNADEIDNNGIDDDNNGFVDDVRGWNFGNNSNDPQGLASTPGSGRHGTHTAGIVCAVANNDTIIAGASWNAKLMPLCAGVEGFDGAIGFGYEAIIYAASNGADIINTSWGGSGNPSLFEVEVIQFAYEQGSVLVAAAGNGPVSADTHYPSAYDHVFSVTNVSFTDVKAFTANFGVTVDVSAQGQSIWSTYPNDSAASLSGTSMSSPHAAAVCALVKTQHPEYTPDQVMAQVRLTSDNIDNLNSVQWRGLLGRGRVNAFRAVTESTPALHVSNIDFDDADGDKTLEPGEAVTINLTITNLLAPASGLTFSLSETSQYFTITSGAQTLPSLGTMESGVISFAGQVSLTAPEQTPVDATLDISATSPVFNDIARLRFVIQPVFVNHLANNIATTVTSVGRYGFAVALGGNGSDGIGFSYKGGPKVLFEGAMMIGASSSSVVDAARNARADGLDDDFATRTDGTPHFISSNPIADEQSVAVFGSSSRDPLYLTVRQDVYGFTDPENDDYLLFRYEITNQSTLAITNMHVGWYNDWDIGGVGETPPFLDDLTGYDATIGVGYSYDGAGDANGAYFGNVVVSSPGTTDFTGILNDEDILGNPWGVYDGFTKSEKWQSISMGIQRPAVGPEDVSYSIGTGPIDLNPGESVVVAMAYVAGDDLPDLQINSQRAKDKWTTIAQRTPVAILDLQAVQEQGDVVLSWRTGREANDVLGYRVLRGVNGGTMLPVGVDVQLNAERAYTFRDETPEPGSYQYRIAEVTGDGTVLLHGGVQVDVVAAAPAVAFIAPNRPNPFNPSTTLSYGLAESGPVRLRVYDGRGRLVRTLQNIPFQRAGFYSATWDGLDDSGQSVASGIYMARLELAGHVLTRRMTLLK